MRRAYRVLLRLYPLDFRAWFAAEMFEAFEGRARARRAMGRAALVRFACAEMAGLITGAAAEWAAKLATDPGERARSVPDLRMMRPPGITREAYFARECVEAWRNPG